MSVTMYAISGVGSDTNSGSTTSSTPKASGTGASTIVGATVDLSVDTPDLSTVVVGDTIRLNARVDGKNSSDIFEITAVDDGLDTVNVSPAPNSITSGVTWAIGGAFVTLGKLIFSASAGDILYCNGIFDESIDMVNTTAAGAIAANGEVNAFPRIIGYTTTPGDNGMAILDSNNTKSNAIILKNNSNYWSFENIRITRYTGQGFRYAFTTFASRFINCEVDHCGGTLAFGVPQYSTVIDCYSHDNAGNGFETPEMSLFANCVCVANSGHGFYGTGGNHYYTCLSKANLLSGFYQSDDVNHKSLIVFNCIVDGSGITQTGIRISDDAQVRQAVVMNNIVINCVSGIVAQSDNGIYNNGYNNLVYNCTTPRVNFTDVSGSVSGEPLFVNSNILDYTPAVGGAQISAGFDLRLSSWINFV
jgi:hypothetical protein